MVCFLYERIRRLEFRVVLSDSIEYSSDFGFENNGFLSWVSFIWKVIELFIFVFFCFCICIKVY